MSVKAPNVQRLIALIGNGGLGSFLETWTGAKFK